MNGRQIYENMTGFSAETKEVVKVPFALKPGQKWANLGNLTAVEYQGSIDGEPAHYRHEFEVPVKMCGPSEKGALVLLGAFEISDEGIRDLK